MFPLKQKKVCGYRFKDKTFYSKHHLGTDFCAHNATLYAPFDGEIIRSLWGVQGGNTIWYKPKDQDVIIRFLHLSWRLGKGKYKEGEIIGKTGNTGALTKNPHLHLDISKHQVILGDINNFIDPEKFDWEKTMKTDKIKKTKKAIKKYIYDFGKFINEREDNIIAHKIEAMFDDNKELQSRLLAEKAKPRITYKQEFNSAMDKLKQCRIDYQAIIKGSEEKEYKIQELQDRIKNQAKEITRLKALNEKNAKKASFWDSFVFLIKTAIKK